MSDKKIRRLGTWDSRKSGQSPKEMKKLLEKADDTLKSTKMKPEFQSKKYIYPLEKVRIPSIISSNKPESAKVRNPLTIFDRSTGGSRSSHVKYLTQKHYKYVSTHNVDSPSRTGVIGAEVTRNPMLRKSATDKVKDKCCRN